MDILKSIPSEYYTNRAIGPEGFKDKLYKFYSIRKSNNEYNENLFNTLVSNYLWHSNPLDFNDPFDCYSELIYYDPTPEAIKQLVNNGMTGTREEKRREIGRLTKRPELLTKAFKETAISQGVCCFSKNLKSNLMWSHYSKSHTGLCLIFDHKKLIASGLKIYRVIYEETFKALNYFDTTQDALFCKFTTKSIEWKYEEEYRSIHDDFGKIGVTKSSFIGITFGCKTTSEDIDYVKKLVIKAGYQNIEWYQARMQSNSFDLRIETLL